MCSYSCFYRNLSTLNNFFLSYISKWQVCYAAYDKLSTWSARQDTVKCSKRRSVKKMCQSHGNPVMLRRKHPQFRQKFAEWNWIQRRWQSRIRRSPKASVTLPQCYTMVLYNYLKQCKKASKSSAENPHCTPLTHPAEHKKDYNGSELFSNLAKDMVLLTACHVVLTALMLYTNIKCRAAVKTEMCPSLQAVFPLMITQDWSSYLLEFGGGKNGLLTTDETVWKQTPTHGKTFFWSVPWSRQHI